jgi:cyclohexadieny/prephenate dehydrogenase
MIFERVALIGLGLIASSMAHAMRRGGLAGEITGYARSAETRAVAREIGLCDRVCDTAREAVEGADLVVLCVPVGAMGEVARDIAPVLRPGAVLSDVGSVKRAVIEAVAPHVPEGVHFVPAHPLAGTEYSGPRSGFATLFDNRWCILVPERADAGAVGRLRALWEGMGANVDQMDADHHDLVLAVVSHTPHLIAYTMVGVADHLRRVSNSEVIKYSASGFRDFTRIAASDPTMWRDVFLTNRDATLDVLGRFTEELFVLQRAIRMGDGDHLHAYFTRTRAIRKSIVEAGQDTAAPDFGRAPVPGAVPGPGE